MKVAFIRSRASLRSETGMTLIELLVAMVVLGVGVFAVLQSFTASRELANRAEARNAMVAVARGEIQRIESLAWSNIALPSTPTTNPGATSQDPSYYISSGPCAGSSNPPATSPCYQWDWSNPTNTEPLVISSSSTDTSSNPRLWSNVITTSNNSVRLSGGIYRYITWVNDPNCTAAACGGSNDYKRITVAVTVCYPGTSSATCTDDSAISPAVEMSTLWVNPLGGTSSPLTQSGITCNDGGSSVTCTH